jgi:uncharacterized protein (TIGR02147 family)
MLSIFDYTNYREYLADYYKDKKSDNPNYSYQVFTDRAGFKNKSFIFDVIKGNKNLSKTSIFKISQAMNHNRYEAEYFENMAAFNQARTLKERNHFFKRMGQIKRYGRGAGKKSILRKDQYEFYSKWYHVAIRSLIDMYEFKDDYKWLARQVSPLIKPKQAKESVALLERLGLISRKTNGTYKISNKTVTTGPEILSLAVQNFHVETMKMAAGAVNELPKNVRNITGLTLGISMDTYENICEEIEEFRSKILKLAERDNKADTVFRLNFHVFPMSKIENGRSAQ